MDEGHALSRREVLGTSAAGALAFLLAGCGGSSSKLPPVSSGGSPTTSGGASTAGQVPAGVPGPAAQGGTRGGRVVNVFDSEGNSYDPAIGYSSTGWEAICNLLYSPLYSYGADGSTPLPNAAAALPQISADGRVYTIPLRPGVRFHNGRAVVAGDYKYAIERTLDPALQSWAASYLYTIKGAEARYTKKATEVTGLRVVDDRTLEVTLVQPDVTFLYALTQPFTAPVPKEEVVRYGKDFSTHAVGNGPFRLDSYDAQGQKMTFTRFADHFWPGLPYLDEVELRWGVDQGVQLLMLERGEVDLAGYGLSTASIVKLNASSRLKNFEFEQPLFSNRWVNLHPRVAAFKDPRVRQALNFATDRSQLDRITAGGAAAWGLPFPQTMLPGAARTAQAYGYDPDRAKSLLQQAGVSGVTATLWTSDSPEPELGAVLQQQWKAVGVNVKLKQATADTINELTAKNQVDAWFSTYYAIYPTAIDVISQYWETGGSANYTSYSNKTVDALTAQARGTADPTARNALLGKVEAQVAQDAAGVFLQNVNWLMGIDRDKLRNFHYSGVYGTYYDRLWRA